MLMMMVSTSALGGISAEGCMSDDYSCESLGLDLSNPPHASNESKMAITISNATGLNVKDVDGALYLSRIKARADGWLSFKVTFEGVKGIVDFEYHFDSGVLKFVFTPKRSL